MLISRYLNKEVFLALIALTAILLLIFMSNQFIQYLNRVAIGNIPGIIILKLMLLELPNLVGLLLPLGFYVALLIAYGRLYAENEMTVLLACGYGPSMLYKCSFLMAAVVSAVVSIMILWVNPVIAKERARLLRNSGVKTLIQTIIPGQFRQLHGGEKVFYVESISKQTSQAQHIFLARQLNNKDNHLRWQIVWSELGWLETDVQTAEDYIVLQDGKEYEGSAGQANYQVAQFAKYKIRLPHPVTPIQKDIRAIPTMSLLPFANADLRKAAELQWRLSIPIMVFTLTLVAIPLSQVNVRTGKYAKILPALIIFILYANFLFVSRDWIMTQKIPPWIGVWWLHIVVILLGLYLNWRSQMRL